jgi:hypothetical protein
VILHPGILALLFGGTLVLAMLLYASGLAVGILRRWDFSSSSEAQLALERKTYLASTLVQYALGFEMLSLLLFVFTLDEIHPLFVGAMCATGVLNAAPWGWAALWVKILVFFAAALWVALNHLDTRAEDIPLTRMKFSALLLLAPLVAAELLLQAAFFLALRPELITSCCGSLFSAEGGGVAAELAGLPAAPMIAAFYGSALLFLGSGLGCRIWGSAWLRRLFALAAAILFPVGLAAIVSFISLYIYELPTHHCPFDLLQKNYGFIGYPLYLGLFGATLFGLLPGLFRPLRRIPSLGRSLAAMEGRWIRLALALALLFLLLAAWPMVFGEFRLAGSAELAFPID